jgi:taurine dioxygenase
MRTASPSTIEVTPLAGSLGARISGIDVTESLDDVTMTALRSAFLEHCVVVFADQDLTPEAHVAFAARWGELHMMPMGHLEGHPYLIVVDTKGSKSGGTDTWHSDVSFQEEPPAISLLAERVLPPIGGDTMFANQYLAYETLTPAMRQLLDPLRAVHSGAIFARLAGVDESAAPSAVHPVVRTHPETGRRALYVNSIFTSHFEGMTVEESRPLLQWLYAHCSQPNLTFRQHWSKGDLVMWDNRCVQHYAIHDYGDESRLMHRATVAGDRPS